jgi:membrane fusion protein, heavy metal efflux system
VVRVHVGPGDRVAAGSPLITVRSPDGAASRADADAAGATVQAARAAERRDRTLFEQGWVSQARLDVTAAETRRAEAQHRAARARVGAFGAPGADGLTVVRSPIAGVVTRLSASPGQVLHEEALQVAAVADPGRVELVFEAPPAAAAILKVGDRLESTVAGSRVLSGVVVAIAPANTNGVVVVRARPAGETPPAGSVVSARVSAGAASGTPVVPIDAVQTAEGAPSVFVQEDGGFRARPVVTGRTSDGRIEIVSGLTGTERIAGVGAFLLKAELAKGEAEHGH